jgi:hypothetical protein
LAPGPPAVGAVPEVTRAGLGSVAVAPPTATAKRAAPAARPGRRRAPHYHWGLGGSARLPPSLPRAKEPNVPADRST